VIANFFDQVLMANVYTIKVADSYRTAAMLFAQVVQVAYEFH